MVPIDLRLRSWIPDTELDAKKGRIVTDGDYNVLVTGPCRLYAPSGPLLGVYLPGALTGPLNDAWDVLSRIRQTTDNRGAASGTPRQQRGDQKRTRTRLIMSTTVGAVDPGPSASMSGRLPACRLTAWTGQHHTEWLGLAPVFEQIADRYQEWAPDRYEAQARVAGHTDPAWLISHTPFTTVTVNNSYSTGVHQDAGDLPAGFSTLAVARRGAYTGGHLVWPRYRVAFDMRHGDLLVFDAHEWHGNTAMTCPHQPQPLSRPCVQGCERVSLVTYYRTKVQACGTPEAEYQKAAG